MFDVTENLKHKAILMMVYSAGLRVSEVCNLNITDIDSGNMQILIRQCKGKKDRLNTHHNTTLHIMTIMGSSPVSPYACHHSFRRWRSSKRYSRKTWT
ncbi:tyrosine-type recombinase/integrase [Clostridium estertheticum]|uniref:tyrosine-type recombinase/integrase n=1 Tax=Clostridium estertheticum TaxID=238834 RepID=UPI001CF4BAFE|nr:tyrosine-type recombinase/integrase [Clostridium estertheticum]MCB2357677.1 tyrosine-type recombinase/integrase [Clostridium estertheticum]